VRAAIFSLMLLAGCDGARSFEEPVVLGGRSVSPDVLNRGELLYMRYCRGCHGQAGRGDGPYSSSLAVRPRDLTSGEYPRLAPDGALPTDAVISRAITHGIDGTAMPGTPVSGEELDALVAYVKVLAPRWRE
jgi:mono/diheme cytochrome c family protein